MSTEASAIEQESQQLEQMKQQLSEMAQQQSQLLTNQEAMANTLDGLVQQLTAQAVSDAPAATAPASPVDQGIAAVAAADQAMVSQPD